MQPKSKGRWPATDPTPSCANNDTKQNNGNENKRKMGHTNTLILAATLICLHGSGAWAQTSAVTSQQTSTTAPQEDRLPVNIHGTIRSKYEY